MNSIIEHIENYSRVHTNELIRFGLYDQQIVDDISDALDDRYSSPTLYMQIDKEILKNDEIKSGVELNKCFRDIETRKKTELHHYGRTGCIYGYLEGMEEKIYGDSVIQVGPKYIEYCTYTLADTGGNFRVFPMVLKTPGKYPVNAIESYITIKQRLAGKNGSEKEEILEIIKNGIKEIPGRIQRISKMGKYSEWQCHIPIKTSDCRMR